MSRKFKIQKAGVDDIPLIRELCFQVWPQTYASILSPEQIEYMLERSYSSDSLKKQMDNGSQFIFISENKEPVGFAAYFEKSPSIFKLDKIYILPTQQGKGTGKLLVDHIIHEVKREGANALQLQVNRYNLAKKFYERLGFVVIDTKDFDIGNGFFMNDYVMEKDLG
jgi:GNAT superfamily N-acetyltransferase